MTVRIIQGDIRDELPKMEADYFDCIVTSPPYFGLRDYGCDGQIGLEATLDEYIETMVAVCRDLRRVLKPSGVFFLNIGDSYTQPSSGRTSTDRPKNNVLDGTTFITRKIPAGLKPKDLCLVPERLGIALQRDGWWVRSHIIWAKPNPMPESVTDRPTSAHETIWMLTKSARYFWDAEAVAEAHGETYRSFDGVRAEESLMPGSGPQNKRCGNPNKTRNMRNVWSVASHSFSGAHFATMPPDIAERCIKAGSSERGCCPACGAPWVRITSRGSEQPYVEPSELDRFGTGDAGVHRKVGSVYQKWLDENPKKTIGWQPSCKCRISGLIDCMPYTPIPSRILDPFAGAGTTGLVADRLGRDATLIDLNTSYIDMAVNRIRGDAPLFAEVAAE